MLRICFISGGKVKAVQVRETAIYQKLTNLLSEKTTDTFNLHQTKQVMLKRFLPTLLFVLFFSAAHAQATKATRAQITKAKQFYKSGIQFRNNNQFSEALGAFSQA